MSTALPMSILMFDKFVALVLAIILIALVTFGALGAIKGGNSSVAIDTRSLVVCVTEKGDAITPDEYLACFNN